LNKLVQARIKTSTFYVSAQFKLVIFFIYKYILLGIVYVYSDSLSK